MFDCNFRVSIISRSQLRPRIVACRCLLFTWVVAGLIPLISPERCNAQTPLPHPRVVVVLCDALQFDDLNNPELPALLDAARHGSIGMMNCAVSGKKTETAAMLTLAAGTQIASEATDGLAFNDWEAPPGENGEARMAYMRRVGPLDPDAIKTPPDPERSVKHLGIAPLGRRGLDTNRLGGVLAGATEPVHAWLCGNADTYAPVRTGALLTVDSTGVCAGIVSILRHDNSASFGLIDDPLALVQAVTEASEKYDFMVVQTGDLSRLEAARHYLSDQQFHARRDAALRRLNILIYGLTSLSSASSIDLMIISPRPIADASHGYAWNRLTPVIAIGPDFAAGLLTSDTTRRTGLVANIDVAPSILSLFHLKPTATMTGRPVRTVKQDGDPAERLAALGRLDFVSHLNELAKSLLLYPLGAACFLLVAGALVVRRKRPALAHWFAPALVASLNIPAAMLFATVLMPPTLLEYGLRILGWMVGLTLLSYVVGVMCKLSPALSAMWINLICIVADTLTGQTLQKDSLFCTYTISGLRFYGLGNEYLGIVIVYGALGVFCLLDELRAGRGRSLRRIAAAAGVLWGLLGFVCGWPGLGANAGSLTVTAAAFGAGVLLLLGMRVTWRPVAALTIAGLLCAFAFSWLDVVMNGAHSSHAGAAMIAARGGRGTGYLLEIVARKVALNYYYLGSPAVVLGVAAILICVFIGTKMLGGGLEKMLSARPWLASGVTVTAIGCVVAVMFKDSGVVTVDFMLGALIVLVTYYVVNEDLRPRTQLDSLNIDD